MVSRHRDVQGYNERMKKVWEKCMDANKKLEEENKSKIGNDIVDAMEDVLNMQTFGQYKKAKQTWNQRKLF